MADNAEAQSTPASAPGSSGPQGALECPLEATTHALSGGEEPLVICTTTDPANKVFTWVLHVCS